MDRKARHVVASRGGNRRRAAAHNVPGFLWRISKRAERPELSPEEKLRLPKVSILFPYGSLTRSLSLPRLLRASLSLSLSFPFSPSLFLLRSLSRDVISLSLAHITLHHSLSPTLSFTFAAPYLARAVFSLSSVSKLFLASPFVLPFLFLERFYLPIFIFLSARSFIRARSLRARRLSFIHSISLSFFDSRSRICSSSFSLFSVSLHNRFLPRATDKPFSVSRCTIHLSGVA